MSEAWDSVRQLVEAGGDVLWVIFLVVALMWGLVFERSLYFLFVLPSELERRRVAYRTRAQSLAIGPRRQLESQMMIEARALATTGLSGLGSLIGVCPLLGLLGTVVGMLELFDVISLAGTGNPRAMAAGISTAIISTLAGLVGALSGFLPKEQLNRHAERTLARFGESLGSLGFEGRLSSEEARA